MKRDKSVASPRAQLSHGTSSADTDKSSLVPKKEGESALPSASEMEDAAFASYAAKCANKPPMPRTKVETKAGVAHLSFDHANQTVGLALVANAFGTGSPYFAFGLLGQLANVSGTGEEIKSTELDFLMTIVRGIGPKDETEALLAVQMAAIHGATMNAARRLNHAQSIPEHDSNSTALNKLARTFAAQLEALKRYRTASEPTAVNVQRLTVNDGGQAIVGNICHGGDHEKQQRSIPSGQSGGAPAAGTALLGHLEAVAPAMPGPSREGQAGLPVPRRSRRRTRR